MIPITGDMLNNIFKVDLVVLEVMGIKEVIKEVIMEVNSLFMTLDSKCLEVMDIKEVTMVMGDIMDMEAWVIRKPWEKPWNLHKTKVYLIFLFQTTWTDIF